MEIYKFFGLKEDPFSMVPNPKIFFESKPHYTALQKSLYGIKNQRGAVCITGEVGTGKSILLRRLLLLLHEEEEYDPLLILCAHSDFDRQWFLNKLIRFYKRDESVEQEKFFSFITGKIMENYEKYKEKTVLLIDEADKIKDMEIFEDIRNLLNLESLDDKIFSIVMVGSQNLKEHIKNYPSLFQRIGIWANLDSMSEQDVINYIQFRINVCGGNASLFTSDAISRVTYYSKGIPRWINVLCDSALLEAYLEKRERIDRDIIEKIVQERGIL